MKLGNEVEGKLKGLYTLFMDAKEAKEFFQFKSLKERAVPAGIANTIERVKHVYISDHENTIGCLADCLYRWLDMGMPVTLEVTDVRFRDKYPANVMFMLNIKDDSSYHFTSSFSRLADTDQIKFAVPSGVGFQVWCVTKENMTKTYPAAFDNDIEFKASRATKFRTVRTV